MSEECPSRREEQRRRPINVGTEGARTNHGTLEEINRNRGRVLGTWSYVKIKPGACIIWVGWMVDPDTTVGP